MSKENHTWMVKEELPKPMEEVGNMELVEGDPSKTTKIGKELQQSIKRRAGEVFEKESGCLCMDP